MTGWWKSRWFYIAVAVILVVGAAWGVAAYRERTVPDVITLYGNVDVRQVNLGFRVGGRIAELAVDEGDRVKPGDVIAKLDKATYLAALKAAEAQLARAKAELEKLENGSRPEEIEQAAAAVEMFKAAERNAVTERGPNGWRRRPNCSAGRRIMTIRSLRLRAAESSRPGCRNPAL